MKEEQELLKLIKVSQFSGAYSPGKEIDWNVLYDEAVSHAVLGIVSGVVPKDIAALDSRWKTAVYKHQASYVRYCRAEEELGRVLNAAGIPFVILKGNAAAVYYRKPELRRMGDIDFLVLQKDFAKAREVLIQNGYKVTKELGYNPRHMSFKKNGVSFELHHHFSHDDLDIEEYLIEGLSRCVTASIGKHEFPMLPESENGLVLLDHMRNHLKSGMGLRQIIDWMMYVNAKLTDEEWNSGFGQIVKEKGLEKFTVTITRMCQIYLGLPESITWCKDADPELCRKLMINVLKTGNFGYKHAGGESIERVSTIIQKRGLFCHLQYAGELNWKACQMHHWLKPFAWIYQILRYIRKGLQTGRNRKQVSGDFKRGKERAELLRELGI